MGEERVKRLVAAVDGHPERVEEVLSQLLAMLEAGGDLEVMVEVITGLGFTQDARAAVALAPLVSAAEAEVRLAAARSLPIAGCPPEVEHLIVEALIQLTTDVDDEVRDWACFGFSNVMAEVDSPAIREALAARLADRHTDTRCEALLALAKRKDPRATEAVKVAFSADSVWSMEIEAAAYLGDPSMHEMLIGHTDGWPDQQKDLMAQVAWRVTDPAGLGDDLIEGLATTIRDVANGLRERAGPDPWWELLSVIEEVQPSRAAEIAHSVRRRLAGTPAESAFSRTRLAGLVA